MYMYMHVSSLPISSSTQTWKTQGPGAENLMSCGHPLLPISGACSQGVTRRGFRCLHSAPPLLGGGDRPPHIILSTLHLTTSHLCDGKGGRARAWWGQWRARSWDGTCLWFLALCICACLGHQCWGLPQGLPLRFPRFRSWGTLNPSQLGGDIMTCITASGL